MNASHETGVFEQLLLMYWPSTEPSIKRCTYVNKRKNSGSRWTLENNITKCPDGSSELETGCRSENQLADWELWALSDPRLSNLNQDAKEVLLWSRKNLGQYSSSSLSPLISHIQQTSPFRKKSVRDLYFYKEVYSFVIEVVIISWLCSCVDLYTPNIVVLWLYNIKTSIVTISFYSLLVLVVIRLSL